MDSLFRWIESTPLSVWTRESTSVLAFPAILSAHAIGMALAAGVNAVIALHLLGVGSGIPTRELRGVLWVMWVGLGLNVVSGLLLLVAYPTKALTNPLFYLKLVLLAAALGLFARLNRRLFHVSTPTKRTNRMLAVASLLSWGGIIVAGRLLAYTYRRLLVDF
jgi:hypothetical protein